MSRAYRIKVRESLRRVIRAEDHVSTQLELLQILSKEEMSQLLGAELEKRGFHREGQTAVREENGVRVEVDLESGDVTVAAEGSEQVELSGQREGYVYEEMHPTGREHAKEGLRQELRKDLEKSAEAKTQKLQKEITDRLEGELADVKQDLDKAVNRATAEALKKKAARLGEIKQLTEDPETDSLTIVVEV